MYILCHPYNGVLIQYKFVVTYNNMMVQNITATIIIPIDGLTIVRILLVRITILILEVTIVVY